MTTQIVNVAIYGTIDASASATAINVNLSTDTGTGVDAARLPYGIDVIGSAGNDIIYGDNAANVLQGGAGKDELHGLGGNDRITGGIGDDRIFGEDGDDDLDAGDGNDMLNGGANRDVMRGGIGNDTLYGGGDNDRLYGNEGDDKLYGDGGADYMAGGTGNDIYQVDNLGDQVIENAGEGSDTVQAFTFSHTLAANVENLQLMGTAAINGTGNTAGNVITGNTANNVINGGGGADTLTGGGGNDTFAWARTDVTTATGLDHITDFGAGDRLDFSAVFNNTHPTNIPAVLHATDTAAGTVISASNGAGAFVDIVILDGVHTTLDDLQANGQLVV